MISDRKNLKRMKGKKGRKKIKNSGIKWNNFQSQNFAKELLKMRVNMS